MSAPENKETFIPIFISQDEYNEIMKQPQYMHQQLLKQLYEKQQQPQINPQQQHPYIQQQQIQVPPIPTQPNQQQPYYQYNPYQQQQQQQYTPQQQIYQQFIPPQQPQQLEVQLNHQQIIKAGVNEVQHFNTQLTYYLALQNIISIIINFFSAIFGWRIVTGYYDWSGGLTTVIILFVFLNIVVLVIPKFLQQGKNQHILFVAHTTLYVLMMQGLQTIVSGYSYYYSYSSNYFFYFYLTIVTQIVSVHAIARYKGLNEPASKYAPYLTLPVSTVYLLTLAITGFRFYFAQFFWTIIVAVFGWLHIHIVQRINKMGLGAYKTNDSLAVCMNFYILITSPFYDNE